MYMRVIKKSLTHVLRGEDSCSGFNGNVSGVRVMMLRLGRVVASATALLPEETILAISILSPNVPGSNAHK